MRFAYHCEGGRWLLDWMGCCVFSCGIDTRGGVGRCSVRETGIQREKDVVWIREQKDRKTETDELCKVFPFQTKRPAQTRRVAEWRRSGTGKRLGSNLPSLSDGTGGNNAQSAELDLGGLPCLID